MSRPMDQSAGDLDAARRGNDAAFARLYDRHAGVILALCRARAPGDAEDALQEVFIRAHAKLDEVDGPERLRAWLYGIARRVCSERNRARRRRTHHEEHAVTDAMTRIGAPHAPIDDAERGEGLDRLGEALDALDDDQRLALHLYYLDADPVRAAAEALGLSRSGYYKLLQRARNNLATILREVKTA